MDYPLGRENRCDTPLKLFPAARCWSAPQGLPSKLLPAILNIRYSGKIAALATPWQGARPVARTNAEPDLASADYLHSAGRELPCHILTR